MWQQECTWFVALFHQESCAAINLRYTSLQAGAPESPPTPVHPERDSFAPEQAQVSRN
jgi:hypothetical protein